MRIKEELARATYKQLWVISNIMQLYQLGTKDYMLTWFLDIRIINFFIKYNAMIKFTMVFLYKLSILCKITNMGRFTVLEV